MLEGMKEAKRRNNERIFEEHKAEEEVRQKLKEDADKKKEQEAMLKNAAKSKKNLEEKEKIFEQEERKLDEEFNLAQRMLDQAITSLTEAIGKGDMVGVRFANELVNSSKKKVDEAVLMRKQHVKDRNKLGKNEKIPSKICSRL